MIIIKKQDHTDAKSFNTVFNSGLICVLWILYLMTMPGLALRFYHLIYHAKGLLMPLDNPVMNYAKRCHWPAPLSGTCWGNRNSHV